MLGCSVAEAQRRISSREFAEWMAFYSLEPFGEERADYRAAQIVAMIANVNRDPKKRSQPYTPADFMPQFDRPEKDWRDLLAAAETINAAMGGTDLRAP